MRGRGLSDGFFCKNVLEQLAVNSVDSALVNEELPLKYTLYDGEDSTLKESKTYFEMVLKERGLDVPVVMGKNGSEDYGCLINVKEYLIGCIWE